jgi:ankyrin repeat protein
MKNIHINNFLNFLNEKNNTGWFNMIYDNNLDKVKEIVEQGIDINIQDNYGNTGLILAIVHSYNDIAKFLIKNGADVNIDDGHRNPLNWALHELNIEIISLLITKTDLSYIDDNGDNALLVAAKYNNTKIIKMILETDIDFTIINKENMSFLDYLNDKNFKIIIDEYPEIYSILN